MAVYCAIPGADFSGERLQLRNAPYTEALSRRQADFDLGLVEPASMSGRVVHGEPIPDFAASLFADVALHLNRGFWADGLLYCT